MADDPLIAQKLDLAFEAGRLGLWEWVMDTGEVIWSPQLEALYRMETGTFGGRFDDFVATIHPEDRDRVLAEIDAAVAELSEFAIHYRARRIDGTVMWIRGVARFITDDEGRPVRLVGIAVDDTERSENDLRLIAAYQNIHRLARTLQASLLPPALPEPPGVELAARFQMGGDDVSGDFYDAFRVDRDRWAVVIGDVCGHGVDAASLTAELRHSFRTAALLAGRPSQVMETVNRVHRASAHADRYASAHYATFRTSPHGSMQLQLATAGHPHVFHVRHDDVVPRRSIGPLLGIFDDAVFEARRFTVRPGDRVVFITDGVLEARRPGPVFFGEEGVIATLEANRGSDLDSTVDAVVDAAIDFARNEVRDDIAVLALQRTAV